jgi:hypothetical protein
MYLPGRNQENHKYPQVQTANLLAKISKSFRQPISCPITVWTASLLDKSETSPDSQSPDQNLKPVQTASLLAKI